MASVLDKYGIKEVADVTFYKIDDNGQAGAPVLYLDTLKVSTVEQTAEETSARGGKGNPPLVTWDYGKEITVTLEDALFSAKSMAILFGNGTPASSTASMLKTVAWTATSTSSTEGKPSQFEGPNGIKYNITATGSGYENATEGSTYDATGATVSTNDIVAGNVYYTTYSIPVASSYEIEISGYTYPGTYYVTGDTYARSEKTGKDEFFQFIIPKAKIQSQNTITMQAEGDPSVFNLNLQVLRPANGAMMKLVKYDVALEEDKGM